MTNKATTKAFWFAQNEDTDESFCLLQGEAAFEPERRALAEMGAPDTELLVFHDIQPEDRDNAICEAECTIPFIEWLEANEMLEQR